ncbi:hypothetical protein NU688_17590 [Variovorax sp. ZS18.2.2]|uniref:hypothetical protein n=1 Tax=Variovorax sp. ZS18.2.2 TaxID=2971255 RepID=UPI0021517D00|nr:hypothetical protein [Variovorax sp. ZS18.2.2]MCR6477979.1 hypothetical protein [Variovorax sp. ZS18.2.2]
MTAPTYKWCCFACDSYNAALTEHCASCNFPAYATMKQMEEARKITPRRPKNPSFPIGDQADVFDPLLTEISANEPSSSARIDQRFKWLVAAVVAIVGIYAMVLLVMIGKKTWSLADSGTFGDSFGVLTSLFSGLAFVGLIWTILQQREDLKVQRDDSKEARRQDVVTRLSTIVQNQAAAFRSEAGELKFKGIVFQSPIGLFEMLHEFYLHTNSITSKINNQTEQKIISGQVAAYLKNVIADLQPYKILISGYKRCCTSNYYLLGNEFLNIEDARDLHFLFKTEMPSGLSNFVSHLELILKIYIRQQTGSTDGRLEIFDPLWEFVSDVNAIARHNNLEINEKGVKSIRQMRGIISL